MAKIGRLKKAAARRRSRTFPGSIKFHPEASREGENQWGLMIVFAGAFCLALVAFLSGIWLGKTINDLPYRGETRLQPKREKPQEEKRKSPAAGELKREGDRGHGEEKILVPAEKSPPLSSSGAESAPAKTHFTLQIGAFNNSEEAQKMVSQLQSKGYVAYEVTGKGAAKGMLYRVRVGHFPTLQDARQFVLLFEKKEKIKAVITPEAVP
jgi:hypothetical protein